MASASTTRPRSSRRIPADEPIGLYRQGDFIDLCRGPHLPSTGKLGTAFKLMKRGRRLLARRFAQRDAAAHLRHGLVRREGPRGLSHQLEEAEKRDHRRIGRELDLFHLQEEAAGAVFWHPEGLDALPPCRELHARRLDRRRLSGGQDAAAGRPRLWEAPATGTSSATTCSRARRRTTACSAIKPMNCPCHVQIFKQGMQQLSRPAAAHGRVRLVPPQRALGRAARHHAGARLHPGRRAYLLHRGADHRGIDRLLRLMRDVYSRFRLHRCRASSSRDRPDKRVGADEIWDSAEAALQAAAGPPAWHYTASTRAKAPSTGPSWNSAARRDRPRLAVRHAAGRFQHAGAPRRHYIAEDGQKRRR